MSLSKNQKDIVLKSIQDNLEKSEKAWEMHGDYLTQKSITLECIAADQSQPSKIPGYSNVNEVPKADQFIALVVDMRKSSSRLKTKCKESLLEDGLQRLYYETSALLPAIAETVAFENGAVTEYLGDGALALFRVDKNSAFDTIRAASRAARNCIVDTRNLINSEIDRRYNLPPLQLGVGLSIGNALVTLVGSTENRQPKVFGECVWEATKLSSGVNKIYVSKKLRERWPSSPGGRISFGEIENLRGIDGSCLRFK